MVQYKRKFRIRIQPTPRGNWGDNLAHMLPQEIWIYLRKSVYLRANNRCEICDDFSKTLHCHENWFFDDKIHTQVLSSLMSVCRECHNCIHWFRTEQVILKSKDYPSEYIDILKDHFMKVSGLSLKEFTRHIAWAEILKNKRNSRVYKISYGRYTVDKIVQRYKDLKSNEAS